MVTNAVRVGIRRVAAAGVVARLGPSTRSMSKVPSKIIEQQKRFQQNPHLHGEGTNRELHRIFVILFRRPSWCIESAS